MAFRNCRLEIFRKNLYLGPEKTLKIQSIFVNANAPRFKINLTSLEFFSVAVDYINSLKLLSP